MSFVSREEKDKLQKVGIYQECISMENTLLQNYRALFLGVEVILITLGIGLLTIEKQDYLWIAAGVGMIFCFASVLIFSWGRKRVDYWRDRIFEEVKETDLEKVFEIYKPAYIGMFPSPISPRFWFDVASPIITGAIWILILYFTYW